MFCGIKLPLFIKFLLLDIPIIVFVDAAHTLRGSTFKQIISCPIQIRIAPSLTAVYITILRNDLFQSVMDGR